MKLRLFFAALASISLSYAACSDGDRSAGERARNDALATKLIQLPEPSPHGERSLEEVLAARRSVREFTDEPLTDREISQLLWAAQGITDPAGLRSAPSAGALYPLELYVATSSGLYHYHPGNHELQQRDRADLRRAMHAAALSQNPVVEAPAVFVITAARKYGTRAERYVHMEVGHAAQNLLLEAVAMDLAAVPIGAFEDDQLSKVLQLPGDESPLYLIPVGHPR